MPERKRAAPRRSREAVPTVAKTVARPRIRSVVTPTTEDRLRDWVKSVDPNADVSLGPPGDETHGRGASVHLLDISQQLPVRGVGRPPLQLWLRYLVTTWGADPVDANKLLVELAYSAAEQHDMEIEPQNVSPDTWLALKTLARASFVIRVSARRARALPIAPPVLHPLRLEAAQPMFIAGVVRTSAGIPLADAIVVLPSIARETSTDGRGRFQFVGVPGPPVSETIVVRAKGVETIVKLPTDPARARALLIEFDPVKEGTNAR